MKDVEPFQKWSIICEVDIFTELNKKQTNRMKRKLLYMRQVNFDS